MNKTEFKCLQCGNCCKRYAHEISLTNEDIELWELLGRNDLLFHPFVWLEAKFILPPSELGCFSRRDIKRILTKAEKEVGIQFLWGNLVHGCIFLRRKGRIYECLIHDVKPEMCRNFPFDECGEVDFTRDNIMFVCHGVTEFAKGRKIGGICSVFWLIF